MNQRSRCTLSSPPGGATEQQAPWEFPAPDDLQVVGFYGHTEAVDDDQGGLRARWVPGEVVRGEPSHTLVPGTALPGGRPSTSRPEFLSDDDSALTRFEDEARVFGYLTGRLNDSADRPGQESRP